ncbi:adhesion G protein-coupled receptor L2-like [Limulus polyphemus]|uniref:Adhesion G protein-coupled receptor L2-like n=1 Tax=Limulus polyphemus TaxID=6850 RepID=A0ABM1TGU9_LIMPO|nr:adhesion G protein-coupled receptor L2-like [Limulus polyphemus]
MRNVSVTVLLTLATIHITVFIVTCQSSSTAQKADRKLPREEIHACCNKSNSYCNEDTCYIFYTEDHLWNDAWQLCLSPYPEFPDLLSIFEINSKSELDEVMKFVTSHDPVSASAGIWTSGFRSPVREAGIPYEKRQWLSGGHIEDWLTNSSENSIEGIQSELGLSYLYFTTTGVTQYSVNFDPVNETHSVICEFHFLEKTTTSSVSPSSTPKPQIPGKYCKGRFQREVNWPDTPIGKTSLQPCPRGARGNATWFCDPKTNDFYPSLPSFKHCKQRWLEDLENEVHKDKGLDLLDISSILANKTNEIDLFGGDLSSVLDILSELQNKFDEKLTDKEKILNFTDSVTSTMNNVLDEKQGQAWEDLLKNEQREPASRILKEMGKVGERLGCYVDNNSTEVQRSNIALEVFKFLGNSIVENHRFPSEKFQKRYKSSLEIEGGLTFDEWPRVCDFMTGFGVLYEQINNFLSPLKGINSSLDNTKVNSQVVGFTFGKHNFSFNLPEGKFVRISLEHLEVDEFTNPRCVFWNFSKSSGGDWDESGCHLTKTSRTHTQCSCSHLTNFAVLMDIGGVVPNNEIMNILSTCCCSLSIAALVLSIFCFISFRALRTRRIMITCNLSVCLLVMNLLILTGLNHTQHKVACALIAGVLHYAVLAAFAWMLLEGLYLYQTLVLVFSRLNDVKPVWFYVFGYGLPLVIVAVSSGVRYSDYGTEKHCWLSRVDGLMWSVAGPVGFVILVNTVFFIMGLRSASSVKIRNHQTQAIKTLNFLKGSFSLMVLLGLTWTFGFFLTSEKTMVMAYIFLVLNGLQGLFIFIFHILVNENYRNRLLSVLTGKRTTQPVSNMALKHSSRMSELGHPNRSDSRKTTTSMVALN